MPISWQEIADFAASLPGVEASTSYGRDAFKIRSKTIVIMGRQPDHFVLRASLEEVDMLMETEPEVFFQTDHYKGWPAVLVRYDSADPERVKALIERAWYASASQKQRAARGNQPD